MILPQLRTTRVTLIPAESSDVDLLWAHWRRAPVRQYLWDDIEITREQAEQVIAAGRAATEQHGLGLWCLYLMQGAFAGFVALRFVGPFVELLYGLEPQYWGQGLVTEASRCVLRYAFETLGLERVVAGADAPNRRSFAVLDRLGMEPLDPSPMPGAEYRQLSRARFRQLNGENVES